MLDNRDIKGEIERVAAGLTGLFLLVSIGLRLWRWRACLSEEYKTLLGAIAGRPNLLVDSRYWWDYGLWQLCPDGQLAGIAMIVVVASIIGGAILNWRQLYWGAGCVIIGGYLINAYLFVQLMAAY